MAMEFRNRTDAGRRLVAKLGAFEGSKPGRARLAPRRPAARVRDRQTLDAPLDIVLVRKIGVPWQPELACGAVSDGDDPETFIDRNLVSELNIPADYVEQETMRQMAEMERRRLLYRASHAPLDIAGRTTIVVDDGIATGATMRGWHCKRRDGGTRPGSFSRRLLPRRKPLPYYVRTLTRLSSKRPRRGALSASTTPISARSATKGSRTSWRAALDQRTREAGRR
jgi:hypothetical protein